MPTPPAVTASQMAEVDRLMVEVYRVSLVQMMEQAGLHLARLVRRFLGNRVEGRSIAVVCGKGNNGGGGMVAARHLLNWGGRVVVGLAAALDQLKDVPAQQWSILEALGIEPQAEIGLERFDWVVDAVLGYNLAGPPRQAPLGWIERINAAGRPTLSLDCPSGLDVTTGLPPGVCVHATATLTLALPKIGLCAETARPLVGDLYLADIGVPPGLYQRLGLQVGPLFTEQSILHLTHDAGPSGSSASP